MLNITGKQFGRWTVLHRVGNDARGGATWRCRCQCGNERIIITAQLNSGKSKSCGCLKVEVAKQFWTTHGRSRTRIYSVWRGMLRRCHNVQCKTYPRYGGRGIQVCERWHTLDHFVADMGQPPFKGAEIDRVNNDGNYEPENCRWVTRRANVMNSTGPRFVTINGSTKCVKEWCAHFGISPGSVYKRLGRGWNVTDALSIPPRSRRCPSPIVN